MNLAASWYSRVATERVLQEQHRYRQHPRQQLLVSEEQDPTSSPASAAPTPAHCPSLYGFRDMLVTDALLAAVMTPRPSRPPPRPPTMHSGSPASAPTDGDGALAEGEIESSAFMQKKATIETPARFSAKETAPRQGKRSEEDLQEGSSDGTVYEDSEAAVVPPAQPNHQPHEISSRTWSSPGTSMDGTT